MKYIAATKAKRSFKGFMDSVKKEPVIVTRRNKPVGIVLSLENISSILDFAREYKKSGLKQDI